MIFLLVTHQWSSGSMFVFSGVEKHAPLHHRTDVLSPVAMPCLARCEDGNDSFAFPGSGLLSYLEFDKHVEVVFFHSKHEDFMRCKLV